MNKGKPTVLDLFCGCGGFSLGAARAGFELFGAMDNDELVLETHRRNFPSTKHVNADLSVESGKSIRKSLGLGREKIDLIVGGPPCQGFSAIGRRNAGDPRNSLFQHLFRLVDELRPSFFVCENVPGILDDDFEPIRTSAFANVRRRYVLLKPLLLTASDFGAPTSRRRVFFIGYLKQTGSSLDESLFEPPADFEPITVGKALKGLPTKIATSSNARDAGWQKIGRSHNGSYGRRLLGLIPHSVGDPESVQLLHERRLVSGCVSTIHTDSVLSRFRFVEPGCFDPVSRFVRLDTNAYCPTLRAGTGRDRGSHQAARPIHPSEDRVITPREAARLQGFPDWFRFHPTKWHSFRQIGNSVCPILAELLISSLYELIKGYSK